MQKKKKKEEQLASFLRSIAVWQDDLVIIYAGVETCSLATWSLCTAIKTFSQDGRPSGGQHNSTNNEEQWRNKGTLYFALILWHVPKHYTYTHTPLVCEHVQSLYKLTNVHSWQGTEHWGLSERTQTKEHVIPWNDLRVLRRGSLLCHR